MSLPPRCTVLMIGTPVDGRGGMSAVVAAYRDGGLFDRYRVLYLSGFAEGSPLRKLQAACVGLLRLLAILVLRRVDLVHIHIASGFSFWRKAVFFLVARGFRKPAILHVHGGDFVKFFSASPAMAQKFIRWIFGQAERVVVLSAAWKERLAGIVPAAGCIAIENPVVPPSAPLPRRAERPVVTFLFLGRLERAKGVHELLGAFARVAQAFPAARLVLGGAGNLADCERHAAALGLGDKVIFPGWVVADEKERWLREADVFVLPSHIEGLPISMLEAMSYRLPVVICPVGSIPEAVRDREEALFVPVGDVAALASAMLALARDPALRLRMGRCAERTFAARYGVDSIVPRVEALYDDVARVGRSPQGIGAAARGRVLAVASGGGHWTQLMRLRDAFDGQDVAFVGVKEMYRADVAPHRFYAIPDVSRLRLWALPLALAGLLYILLTEKPEVVITTGSAPGMLALRLAKMLGARTIWIDSIANAEQLSESGRKAGKFADVWLTQWPHLAHEGGPGYLGSLL